MATMTRLSRRLGLAALGAGLVLAAAPAVRAQVAAAEAKRQSAQLTVGGVAAQLGAKLAVASDDEFPVGSSITATLADPEKLARLGLPGLHAGARVTASRVAPDRVRVEVDEIDPVPATRKIALKVDDRGLLVASPKS